MHAAVLVIHGIGEQNPYETLDSFTRGLAGHFGDVSPSQAPVIRPERINHGSWTEVVIHLEFPGPVTPAGLERLTLYEFYWASYTEGKVTYRGVLSWVIQTGLTPLRYLSDNLQALRAANPNQAWGESAWLLLREMLRIGLLYLPIIVLTSLLGVAMTRGVPGLLPLARALGDAIEVEDQPVALAGLAVCLTVGIVLAGFMVREVWQWIRRPDRSIERKAEVAWLATAAVSLVLLAGVVRPAAGRKLCGLFPSPVSAHHSQPGPRGSPAPLRPKNPDRICRGRGGLRQRRRKGGEFPGPLGHPQGVRRDAEPHPGRCPWPVRPGDRRRTFAGQRDRL
jgi:hypothetical protein